MHKCGLGSTEQQKLPFLLFLETMKISLVAIIFTIFTFLSINSYSFTIGSGGKKAMYYPAGKSLCYIYNKEYNDDICEIISTSGAQYNIENIISNNLSAGIGQVSLQYDYFQTNKELRTIIPLHAESLTIAVRKDSKIKSFNDLKGKKVNIGNIGSGSRIYFEEIMKLKGWTINDFKEVHEKSSSYLSDLICSDQVDAVIYFVGHPNQVFKEIISCGGNFVELSKKEVKLFSKISNAIRQSYINTGLYSNLDIKTVEMKENSMRRSSKNKKIRTIGVQTVLSATSNLSEKTAYNIVKIIFEKKVKLESLNPVFHSVDPESILNYKYKAPFHTGVERYLLEKNLR